MSEIWVLPKERITPEVEAVARRRDATIIQRSRPSPEDVAEAMKEAATPKGTGHVLRILAAVEEDLRRCRQQATVMGLWPGEPPSLGLTTGDSREALRRFLALTGMVCDFCYGPSFGRKSARPLVAHFDIARSDFCGSDYDPEHEFPLWLGDAQACVRQLTAALVALALEWGIEGVRPGGDSLIPTRGGESCYSILIGPRNRDDERPPRPPRIDWLKPVSLRVARTMERCERHLGELVTNADRERFAPSPVQVDATPVFNPTPRQRRALELLDGRAMLGKELGPEIGIMDLGLLSREMKPLIEHGLMANDRNRGGYFRPDRPPRD
jgi:hypothetical protein